MSAVYFKTQDSSEIVTMDGETSIEVSKSNTISTSSVMSNRSASDELIEGALTLSVKGVVTYSKSAAQEGNPTPLEWVNLIETAISNKRRFTVYSTKHSGGSSLLQDYPNMCIQSYNYVVDRFEDTIVASLSFQQVFVTESATVTTLPPLPSSSSKSSIQEPSKGGSGTSTVTTETQQKTILKAGADSLINLF